MTFSQAVQNTQFETTTTNGMVAYTTTCNNNVSLFYSIGASRGKDVTGAFERAFQEDKSLAIKIALWARDVRGGAGERKIFRDILTYMETNHPEILEKVIPHIPEYGRVDDLLVFTTKKFKEQAYTIIKNVIDRGILAKSFLSNIESMSEEECQQLLTKLQKA